MVDVLSKKAVRDHKYGYRKYYRDNTGGSVGSGLFAQVVSKEKATHGVKQRAGEDELVHHLVELAMAWSRSFAVIEQHNFIRPV